MNAKTRRAGPSWVGHATQRLFLLPGLLGLAGFADAAPSSIFPADLPQVQAQAEYRDVLVPDGFNAWRTRKLLVVEDVALPLKPVKLLVDSRKVLVSTIKLYIYPAGQPRPHEPYSFGLCGYPPGGGTAFVSPRPDGFLEPGKPFTVEEEITIVEVEPSSQEERFWMPDPQDTVVWQKTFRLTPEVKRLLPEKIRKELEEASKITFPPLPPAGK